MERCPCCNARLKERVICSRCRADLTELINTEKSAHIRLAKAIQYWLSGESEQSIAAITVSLNSKKTRVALVFREFMIHQQCTDILDKLAEKKLLLAKQQLYRVRLLFPHSKQLQQLNRFTDYLLAQKIIEK